MSLVECPRTTTFQVPMSLQWKVRGGLGGPRGHGLCAEGYSHSMKRHISD